MSASHAPRHHSITTAEGGMITTVSEASAAGVRMLALHGRSANAWCRHTGAAIGHYEVVEPV